MNIRHSQTKQRLAVLAARQAGIIAPTVEAAAEHPDARARRDELWAEYERRLRDVDTYFLKDILEWLHATGVPEATLSSVHRDRTAVLAPLKIQAESIAQTRALLEGLSRTADGDLFRANRLLVAQAINEALVSLRTDALADLDAGKFIRLAEAVGRLSVDNVHADLGAEKLAALRRDFQERIKAAGAKSSDGRLPQKDLDEISEAVFGPSR